MTAPFLTVAEARAFVGIRATDTTFDATLTTLVMLASIQIEDETRRQFDLAERVEIFDTPDTTYDVYDLTGNSASGSITRSNRKVYFLSGINIDDQIPVEVRYDTSLVFDDTSVLTLTDDYVVDWAEGSVTLLVGTSYVR